MTTGIYKIQNKINGKIYVGSALNIEDRWRRHKYDLSRNEHHSYYLQRAWNKYWSVSFEFTILEICFDDQLIVKEQAWLNWLKPEYNLSPTAGNSLGVKHSEETRKRMSEAKKKMTEETKRIMSNQRLGRKHSEEHKAKISASNKGKFCSEETKDKIRIANTGKIRSQETKLKISKGNKNLGTKRGRYKPRKGDTFFQIITAPPIGY